MEYHDDDGTLYSVGDIVVVFARTWPGINKPGGVGRIVKVRKNEGETTYDVKYTVEGGRECGVDERYIRLNDSKEDFCRHTIKGRCMVRNCTCFIKDCGHIQPGENEHNKENFFKKNEIPEERKVSYVEFKNSVEKIKGESKGIKKKRKLRTKLNHYQRKENSSGRIYYDDIVSSPIRGNENESNDIYYQSCNESDEDKDKSSSRKARSSQFNELEYEKVIEKELDEKEEFKVMKLKLNRLLDDITSYAQMKSKCNNEAQSHLFPKDGDPNELSFDQNDCLGLTSIHNEIKEAFEVMNLAKMRLKNIYMKKIRQILTKKLDYVEDELKKSFQTTETMVE